jgi:hypothetical protein
MNPEPITLLLPASLYKKLQTLAAEEHTDPIGVITRFITDAYERRSWLNDLTNLRQQIQHEGGLQLDSTKEEVVAELRRTRQEIFEAEYADMYR